MFHCSNKCTLNVRLQKKMNIKCSFDEEEFEDTKEVIRIIISKKEREHKRQEKKDKQRSTKHYT
jgi:NAD kinase